MQESFAIQDPGTVRKGVRGLFFPAKHASLVSPVVDFFMLGGITLILFPATFLLDASLRPHAAGVAFYLLFIINFPHFIHGYQFLYNDYIRKISDPGIALASRVRHIIGGIVAPLILIAFLAYGAMQPDNHLIAYSANAMFFFVGWHYVKQGYGVLMTLSAKKKVYYSEFEKKLLLANAYIVWGFAWIQYNANLHHKNSHDVFQGIPFKAIAVSPDVNLYIKALFVLWTLFAFLVFVKRSDRYPSISVNGFVAYISALYAWVLFAYLNPIFLIFIPALHSLQYLLFVWKLQYEKIRSTLISPGQAAIQTARVLVLRHMASFLFIGLASGYLLFYLLPTQLDARVGYNTEIFGAELFMFCFLIFLNVHHYFIDFAIWRKDNPEMKYLFR